MVVMGRETKNGLQVLVTFSGTRVSTTRYSPCSSPPTLLCPFSSVSGMAPPFRTAISSAFLTVVALSAKASARALFSLSEVK